MCVAAREDDQRRPLLHGKPNNARTAFSTPVIVILFMAICTMHVISCVDWTLLLFLNQGTSLGETHNLYFNATAFALLVPVCANPILGNLSARFGSGTTLCFSYLVAALGIFMMALFRQNTIIFYVAYEVYALCTTLRIVRLSIIAQIVPSHTRTTVMAVHQLMAPIGAMLGPMLWVLIQKWRGHVTVAGWMIIDRFFLNYFLSIGALVSLFFVGMAKLRSLPDAAPEATDGNANDGGLYNSVADAKIKSVRTNPVLPEPVLRKNGADIGHTQSQRRGLQKFAYFCTLTLLMQCTMALVRVSFQPVLIGVYGAGDEEVGKVYSLVGALALVPPIAVALLSRILKDRDIMLIGMVLKLRGALLFLPLFGEVRKWQVVAGFIMCIKASNFFLTATFSAFTKVAGGKKPGKQIGYLWSVCSIGPAVIQFCFASVLVNSFGSWGFGVCALPVLAGFLLVFHPWGWQLHGTQ